MATDFDAKNPKARLETVPGKGFRATCTCGLKGVVRPDKADVERLIAQHMNRAHGVKKPAPAKKAARTRKASS